ncbi:MAG: hypothetical protein K2N16_07045, partial [Muribaculaceae bacterium]|nr:hypothetical protein [Muribaculaceae bacterium]
FESCANHDEKVVAPLWALFFMPLPHHIRRKRRIPQTQHRPVTISLGTGLRHLLPPLAAALFAEEGEEIVF